MFTCKSCNEKKPKEGFYFYKNRNKYFTKCKKCTLSQRVRAVLSPKAVEKLRQKHRRCRKEARDYVVKAKSKPCMDCGVAYHFCVMQFDHRPDLEKKYEITVMCYRGYGINKIQSELDKCDVVCANCHSLRTYQRLEDKKTIASTQ